jgi:hypothetical protein
MSGAGSKGRIQSGHGQMGAASLADGWSNNGLAQKSLQRRGGDGV